MPEACIKETAFESANELHPLAKDYVAADKASFDRERARYAEVAPAFIQKMQP